MKGSRFSFAGKTTHLAEAEIDMQSLVSSVYNFSGSPVGLHSTTVYLGR